MVDTHMVDEKEQAEKIKQLGNAEFKKQNYHDAIKFYTEALQIAPTCAIYSNRAASFLMTKEFSRAMDDCEMAIRLDPEFGKSYKRLFKAHLALGHIKEARQTLRQAIEKEPKDPNNTADKKLMDDAEYNQKMIDKFQEPGNDQDWSKVASYSNTQLENCCSNSIIHICKKMEALLNSHQLKDAVTFSKECTRRTDMKDIPKVQAWCGRALMYSGATDVGKNMLMNSLRNDPDNKEAQQALKNYKNALAMKEEATKVFKDAKYLEANEMFDKILEYDPLNLVFNSIINLNKSIALSKLGKHEESLKCLNLSLKMNPEYAKALVKRAEVNTNLGYHEDAVRDLAKAKDIDSTGNQVQQKLKEAQAAVKKDKKKDYYSILGVSKTATEEEIKKAAKKKALLYHPDRNNESEESAEKATRKMIEVNEAKGLLLDKKKRQAYDSGASLEDIEQGGGMPGGGMGGMDPSQMQDIFAQMMGGMGGGMGGGRGRGGGMPGGMGGMFGGGGGAEDIFAQMMGGQGMGRGGPGSRGGRGGGMSFSFQ